MGGLTSKLVEAYLRSFAAAVLPAPSKRLPLLGSGGLRSLSLLSSAYLRIQRCAANEIKERQKDFCEFLPSHHCLHTNGCTLIRCIWKSIFRRRSMFTLTVALGGTFAFLRPRNSNIRSASRRRSKSCEVSAKAPNVVRLEGVGFGLNTCPSELCLGSGESSSCLVSPSALPALSRAACARSVVFRCDGSSLPTDSSHHYHRSSCRAAG